MLYGRTISIDIYMTSFLGLEFGISKPRPCNTKCQPLPQNSILQKLLTLQKHTDLSNQGAKRLCDKLLNNVDNLERLQELVLWHSMDCTGVSPGHAGVETSDSNKVLNGSKSNADGISEYSKPDTKSSLNEGTCCQPFKDKLIHASWNPARLSPSRPLKRDLSVSDMDAVHQLQRFLLSVTAKDVSLLLTFRRMLPLEKIKSDEDELPIIELEETGQRYRVMISVVDLDPKPVHRIRHWVKRKEEWLKIYSDSILSSPRLA